MGGVRRSRSTAGVAVVCVSLCLPAAAGAASVSVSDGRLVVAAAPGEVNDLVVEQTGEELRVIDLRTPVLAAEGCAPVPDVPSVVAGDRGADVVEGGPGRDRTSYATIFVPGPVRVTLDKLPNDGESREGDRIGRDVEVVEGTSTAADLLAAGESGATLLGLGGEDRLVGGTGRDGLDGGEGGDRIAALDGVRDEVRCGPGADLVIADAFDVLRGCESRGRQRPVLRVVRRAPMVLRLRCPVVYRAPVRPYARRCRGTVTVRRGARRLRSLRIDVPAGQARMLRGPGLRTGDLVRWTFDRVRAPVAAVRVGGA